MNGIHVTWTRRREEYMEVYLTSDQVRERFGLGGTPDSQVARRMGMIATQSEIIAAVEELAEPRMQDAADYQILNLRYQTTDKMPGTQVEVCCTCKQPLPTQVVTDETPF